MHADDPLTNVGGYVSPEHATDTCEPEPRVPAVETADKSNSVEVNVGTSTDSHEA